MSLSMSTWGRRFCRAFSIKLAIFQRNRRMPRTDLHFLPASSSNHNYKDGNENTEIYEHNKYFELEQHISSGAFFFQFLCRHIIVRLKVDKFDWNGNALIGFRSLTPSFRRKDPYSNISLIF